MAKINFLKPGDLIDVVAPAAGFFQLNEQEVHDFIAQWGFKVRFPKNIQQLNADPFSAHNLKTRLNNFIKAVEASDSKAIWCLRGGYGSMQLIPELDKIKFKNLSKIIIGFSDITALHIYFGQKYNLVTMHGRTISGYFHQAVDTEEIIRMQKLLIGDFSESSLELLPLNAKARGCKVINSKIIGGNLTLIEASLATNWQLHSQGKILLIEECNEKGYRIDRSLEHLKQAKIFDKIKAVIIGDIDCAVEPDGTFRCNEAITRFTDIINVPIFKTNQIGHGKINYPILFGYDYQIVQGNKITLNPVKHD
jgi:muramoyltetrapeptide carboxypeptidase